MKKVFSSFVLTSALTLGNLSAITAEYVQAERAVIPFINKKELLNKENIENINYYLSILKESSVEFKEKVTDELLITIPTLIREYKSFSAGGNLSLVAMHLNEKEKLLKTLQNVLRKDKLLKKLNIHINEMLQINTEMKVDLQSLINLAYMGIEAKGIFDISKFYVASKRIDMEIDDYWFDYNIEESNDNVLYLSAKYLPENINVDEIFSFERELSEEVKKSASVKANLINSISTTGGYSHAGLAHSFFSKVSFI